MAGEIEIAPEFKHTIDRLEALKRTASSGVEYWMARDIQAALGYITWEGFDQTVDRAKASLKTGGVDPSHHIRRTSKMMGVGKGASREIADYFLSRAACRLIAMNGDPSKAEIAAAQAYFVVQTHRMEQQDVFSEDQKRIEEREKVTNSFKAVSSAAKEAGVQGPKQGLFHNARYEGLYGMTSTQYREKKGVGADNPFDRMGLLELSANDFQMNLAAEKLVKDKIRGEAAAINTNKAIAQR
ncbi:DNA damage-inducible protein D, partial [Salmonella enterica subsp. enterica]|nr:DNA damage-inducible protein D [Salmonella enterica subsp. enterica serovar Neukoelln]